MKNITIVGAGALGSHLVVALRNEKISIKVIDFDRVEIRNVASQFHFKQQIGKKKVDSLQKSLQFCFSRKIDAIGHKLSKDNIVQLLGNSDLIVDCVDNAQARKLIQQYSRKHNIPCIHGALAANGEYGRVCWDSNFEIDEEPSGGAKTCEDGEFLPFIQVVASFLAIAIQKFLRENKQISFEISPTSLIRCM